MVAALQAHVGDVTRLDPGWGRIEPLRRALSALPEPMARGALWRSQLALSRLIAPALQRQLTRGRYDVLFCPYGLPALAGLRLPPGMLSVYTADTTPTTDSRSALREGRAARFRPGRLLEPVILGVERRVLRAMDLLLWPTEWLKSGADGLYGLPPERSVIVPWGAAIADPGPVDLLPRLSRGAPLRCVLITRDWQAQGGPLALDTVRQLRARGVAAELDVIGAAPPGVTPDVTPGVTLHGPLDRPEDAAARARVLRRAHFLFQPTLESYGFTVCEASAYGLPALCLRIGGVPLREGVNGHALPLGAGPAEFAARIETYLAAPEAYAALRRAARRDYETRLNWDSWGRAVDAHLRARHR